MSCVSFKKTQNTTFFVLILKLTFMLMHHSQKIYNYKKTTNSITSSLLIPRDNGRRQFFRHYDYFCDDP